jgi:2-oxoisovalerate dehydrogenase E1 component
MFLVEDNGYAISVPVEVQTPGGSISKALAEFPGLKVFRCDGNCPIDSYATAVESSDYIRKERGPVLVHANVTRPYSHSLSDDHKNYRTQKELEKELEEDVFNSFPRLLISAGFISEEENSELLKEVSSEVKEAMEQTFQTPWPKIETSTDHIFSHDIDVTSKDFETVPNFSGKDDIPMALALNKTLKSEVEKNPFIRMFGEDVADFSQLEKLDNKDLKGKGGVFSISKGVQRVAYRGQVFNSPYYIRLCQGRVKDLSSISDSLNTL